MMSLILQGGCDVGVLRMGRGDGWRYVVGFWNFQVLRGLMVGFYVGVVFLREFWILDCWFGGEDFFYNGEQIEVCLIWIFVWF